MPWWRRDPRAVFDGRRRASAALLFVLSGNMLIDALEVSVVIVALPSIGGSLGLSLSEVHWVMSGFAIGFGGLLLFGGRVVSVLGRRRIYLLALLGFAVASLAGGLVTDVTSLVAIRFVKGFCVALTAPTGLAIIASAFAEGQARRRAISIYSLFGATGFTVGLLLSGLLTPVDWRWTLAFPAPAALVLLAFGWWLIPRDEPGSGGKSRYDVAGAACFTAATAALVYGIGSVSGAGWADPRTIGAFTASGALFVALIAVERSAAYPLIRLDALANASLVRSSLGAACLNGSFWGFLFVCTFQLQAAGWTPLRTAAALLPASVLPMATAPLAGRMVGRFGAGRLIGLGLAAPPVGYLLYLLYLRQDGSPTNVAEVLPAMVLVGAGFALAFAALHVQATGGVPESARAMTSGLYQTSVQIGGVLVLSLSAALSVAGFRAALLLVTTVAVLGFLSALTSAFRRSEAHIGSDA
jgi:MFS family permease